MKSSNPQGTMLKQQAFVNRFASLPFDDPASEAYGRIRAALERSGKPIGANDLLIASIAITNELTLVTQHS